MNEEEYRAQIQRMLEKLGEHYLRRMADCFCYGWRMR